MINALASLRLGRDYLTMDERLLKRVLIKKVKDVKSVSGAVIRNMLVSCPKLKLCVIIIVDYSIDLDCECTKTVDKKTMQSSNGVRRAFRSHSGLYGRLLRKIVQVLFGVLLSFANEFMSGEYSIILLFHFLIFTTK